MFLRLISLLDTHQISQSEFYNTIGVSKQVWNGWKKRGSIPSTRIEAIKKHYPDFDIEYLTTGQVASLSIFSQDTVSNLVKSTPKARRLAEDIMRLSDSGELDDTKIDAINALIAPGKPTPKFKNLLDKAK